jgi:hypothetical protein
MLAGDRFMHNASDIQGVHVTLTIAKEKALFILLTKDGTVNRLGTGAVDNSEKSLFIGKTDGQMFEALRPHITEEMLKFTGGYDIPDQRGESCRLSIGLVFADGSEDGFGFSYGSESEGPPREISNLVVKAAELTGPWYEAQKQMVNPPKKPKWKFW